VKIAYVTDVIYPFVKGGAEKRIYDLSKRLVQNGHEVHIFGIKWWSGKQVVQQDGVFLHGVCNPVPLYAKGRRSIGEAVYFSSNLFWYLLKDDFDVVDCTQSPHLHYFIAKSVSLVKRFPVIITWHEAWRTNDYWQSYMGFSSLLGTVVEIGTIKMANHIIASSYKTKKDLISTGVDSNKINVVPNGIDFDLIQSISPFHQQFDIVCVGRFIKGKNVDVLLQAVAIIVKKFPNLKTGIVGSGPEGNYLKSLVKELDIEDNVHFFGSVSDHDDVISIMKASKILVHPSTQEGGPSIVALEGNACGLPVVAVSHKMGISDELIINGVNGFFAEGLNPEFVAKKISLILDDEKLLKAMRQNSINFARQYDWKVIVNSIEVVYSNVQASSNQNESDDKTAMELVRYEGNVSVTP
jgi:glycosyltransferase involved in cell wall biosynthesis